jgi:hypothetical protein
MRAVVKFYEFGGFAITTGTDEGMMLSGAVLWKEIQKTPGSVPRHMKERRSIRNKNGGTNGQGYSESEVFSYCETNHQLPR